MDCKLLFSLRLVRSLACVKTHKSELGCQGKRCKTKFVSLSNFTTRELLSGTSFSFGLHCPSYACFRLLLLGRGTACDGFCPQRATGSGEKAGRCPRTQAESKTLDGIDEWLGFLCCSYSEFSPWLGREAQHYTSCLRAWHVTSSTPHVLHGTETGEVVDIYG